MGELTLNNKKVKLWTNSVGEWLVGREDKNMHGKSIFLYDIVKSNVYSLDTSFFFTPCLPIIGHYRITKGGKSK